MTSKSGASSSSSVFDRLYQTSTASSSASRRTTAVDNKRSSRSSPTIKTPNRKSSALDRLCRPTESSLCKQQFSRQFLASPKLVKSPPSTPRTPKPFHTANVAKSAQKTTKHNAPKGSTPERTPELTASPITTNPTPYDGWKLTYTSKYDKNKKVLPLSVPLLPSNFIHDFEIGLVDEMHFSHELITALFHRDFSSTSDRWDIDGSTASPVKDGEDPNVKKFTAEKQATWDWKDIYSVASAKGIICFDAQNQDIRVDDYSYYAAG